MSEEMFQPPRPRHRWRNRRNVLILVGVLLAGGLTWGGITWANTCGWLGSGIADIDGQCVGVTDGSFVFSPDLAEVEGRIKAENDSLAGGKSVTIGLLDMYTANADSPLSPAQVREELEGAYIAQYRANHTQDFRDPQPRIRLVLANEGSDEQDWQPAVHDLEGMVNDASPLVAVAGLGVSIQATVNGATDLSRARVPMAGAVITADNFVDQNIPGFVRVQPTDRDYIRSLVKYLSRNQALQHGVIVYDTNSGSKDIPGDDLYTWSLRNDELTLPQAVSYAPLGFQGKSAPSQSNPDMFSNIISNICGVHPDLVFWAGRLADLPDFLTALEHRECNQNPITLATGGTDLGSLDSPTKIHDLTTAKTTIVYSSATDGPDWATHKNLAPQYFQPFLDAFTAREPRADINDGYALAMHDAVATAVMATRLAFTAGSPSGGSLPTHTDVLNQLYNLVNLDYVPGATGNLTFSITGNGNPGNKPLPVLVIPPASGTATASALCPATTPGAMYCTA